MLNVWVCIPAWPPHSPVATLDAAVAQARETGADALISVGGGSTHDTTKGVATVLGEGGRIHDYEAKWVRV